LRNFTIIRRDKDDANFGFVLSEIDNFSQRFVWSSMLARTNAFRAVLDHNRSIVDYLQSTGQVGESADLATIQDAWKFRRIDKPDPKRFYIFQPSDKAGQFEFRSLIDGSVFWYSAADVAAMRAAREAVERWNSDILDQLAAKGWLQPHELFDVATVVATFTQATER